MDIIASLITAGVVGTILTAMIALVRIALGAERHRADDWRTAAQTTTAANAIMAGHVERLTGTVDAQSATLREMMALLQVVVADRRGAA